MEGFQQVIELAAKESEKGETALTEETQETIFKAMVLLVVLLLQVHLLFNSARRCSLFQMHLQA